jgi:hypothetical protein
MGDMADYNLDMGHDMFSWGSRPRRARPYGPGECPVCGGPTHLVSKGKHGPFYGCDDYPHCNGSRDGAVPARPYEAEIVERDELGNIIDD